MNDFKLFRAVPVGRRGSKLAVAAGVVIIGAIFGLLIGWRG
jgi:hypothetical protein